jgi:hypothetical protein
MSARYREIFDYEEGDVEDVLADLSEFEGKGGEA